MCRVYILSDDRRLSLIATVRPREYGGSDEWATTSGQTESSKWQWHCVRASRDIQLFPKPYEMQDRSTALPIAGLITAVVGARNPDGLCVWVRVREEGRLRSCRIATLVHPPLRSRPSDSAASDLFYHVTSTDTCGKAHAHTRPYRKCIISIDLYCSHRWYSYKISRLSQSKTKTCWCTSRASPTPYLLTSLACHRPVLCSICHLSQACSMLYLSLVTGLFCAPSATCHRPVLCSICYLFAGLSHARSVTLLLPTPVSLISS